MYFFIIVYCLQFSAKAWVQVQRAVLVLEVLPPNCHTDASEHAGAAKNENRKRHLTILKPLSFPTELLILKR